MPVLVNPNVPLGLKQFQDIYTAGGLSPEQNAQQLASTAPTAGLSYMSDQWNKLGINVAPEQFFSHPQFAQQAFAQPGGVPGTQANGQPLYANEAQRNTAIALGQNHPFESVDNRVAALAQHLQGVPHPLDDPQLKQLMGEDPKRGQYVYAALTGGGDYQKDADLRDRQAYQQTQTNDERAYTEDNYQKHRLQAEAATRAANIDAFRQRPMKEGIDNVLHHLHNNATFDPNTGKWQGLVEVPGTNNGLSGSDQPHKVLQDLNPETQNDFQSYYRFATGASLPQREIQSPNSVTAAKNLNESMSPEQRAYYDKRYQKLVEHSGQTPSLAARIGLLRETYQTVAPETGVSNKILNNITIPFEKAIGGISQDTTPEQTAAILSARASSPAIPGLPEPADSIPDNQLNFWGQAMQRMRQNMQNNPRTNSFAN